MSEALMQLDAASTEVESHGSLVQYKAFASAFNDLATRADPHLQLIEAARAV